MIGSNVGTPFTLLVLFPFSFALSIHLLEQLNDRWANVVCVQTTTCTCTYSSVTIAHCVVVLDLLYLFPDRCYTFDGVNGIGNSLYCFFSVF